MRAVFDSANTLRTSSLGSSISSKGRAALGGEQSSGVCGSFATKDKLEEQKSTLTK